jgi:hypothetical protein
MVFGLVLLKHGSDLSWVVAVSTGEQTLAPDPLWSYVAFLLLAGLGQ